MFNPDGSEAEMCGNGIRCIARMAEERVGKSDFPLYSGGKIYAAHRLDDIYPSIPTFGIEIDVRLWSDDFGMATPTEGRFVDQPIPQLDASLTFTAINVGNPHIIAQVEEIDYAQLKALGERVIELRETFPHGVNVSLVEVRSRNEIFVATYERGAGITPSCGMAMTSSATAMALLGHCDYDKPIRVVNRGGAVRCTCSQHEGRLCTTLTGNASYIYEGVVESDGTHFAFDITHHYDDEQALYKEFVESLKTV
jgi:diaminopimelate epimerase